MKLDIVSFAFPYFCTMLRIKKIHNKQSNPSKCEPCMTREVRHFYPETVKPSLTKSWVFIRLTYLENKTGMDLIPQK